MGIEIERKYLIAPSKLPPLPAGSEIVQGYLGNEPEVRVRLVVGLSATITVKGSGRLTRPEFEYPIPVDDAVDLLAMCKWPALRKRRYEYEVAGRIWTIDQFLDDREGLWLAEVELSDALDEVSLPSWVTTEVTEDASYSNSALSRLSGQEFAAKLLSPLGSTDKESGQ